MNPNLSTTAALLLLFLFLFTTTTTIATFSPTVNHLVNCGSSSSSPSSTTIDLNHRRFTSDSPYLVPNSHAKSLRNTNPAPNSNPIYHTARLFRTPSTYTFKLQKQQHYLIRLHFHDFNSSSNGFSNALFHVLVNDYVLLRNFNIQRTRQNTIVKDFTVWVDSENLDITFIPAHKSKFAFVNAIEVISAPRDLIVDVANHVTKDGSVRVDGISKNGFENVHRVNVGGLKVTPFNDSLWRSWIPDDEYLISTNSVKKVHYSGRINYQPGGASREVCPDNVYNSARVTESEDRVNPRRYTTWEFPVEDGYKYMVRMHFCDIASASLGLLYFNVYVNEYMAYEDLDLSTISNGMLASPFYADFVVDGGKSDSGVLSVSIGPLNMSVPHAVDGILNGVEIFKMNNSMGSLDGDVCADWVMQSWRRENHVGVLFPLMAAVFVLLSASVVMQRRRSGARDSVAWSRLPVDVSEANLKGSDR